MRLPPHELLLAPDEALLLTGSYARAEADEWSDIDLWVLGSQTRPSQTFYSNERLFVVTYSTLEVLQEELRSPGTAPFIVPAIRQANAILDPQGQAASLKHLANSWHWDLVEPLIAEWLGRQLTAMIEDVYKVCAAIDNSNWDRGYDPLQVLIFGCCEAMVVGLRLMPNTQNRTFGEIRSLLGNDHEWSRSLDRATGIAGPISIADSMRAGVALYSHTYQSLLSQMPSDASHTVDLALRRCTNS